MILASSLPPTESIYTFVDRRTGANINIASARLRVWVLSMLHELDANKFSIPVEPEKARFYLNNNVVSRDRVAQLISMLHTDPDAVSEPLIFAKDGSYTNGRPDVMHIDGHHRYCVYAVLRVPVAPAVILEPTQWAPFQIAGCIDIDEATLQAIPPLQKHYWNKP